jgi:hypothetical protein
MSITVEMVSLIPAKVEYDAEHGEYTASNDDVHVAAAGATEEEARLRFTIAAAALALATATERSGSGQFSNRPELVPA